MAGNKSVKVINKGGAWGGAYFLTVIGSAVYWAQLSTGFGEFVVAMLKACVWPAFVMHRVLELLSMQYERDIQEMLVAQRHQALI